MTIRRPPNTYYIDANHPAEMVRLRNQDQLLTRSMGGLLAGVEGIAEIHEVLDLACGSGGWVLHLAHEYPEMDGVGVDVSQRMVAYANEQAEALTLQNASFRVMDVTKPLGFATHSFDLVNGRFLGTFMPTEAWLPLFQECRRILRPGGTLCITEFERALTNSPAHERLSTLFTQSQHRLGMGFAPDGNHMGTLPMLGGFFRQTGLEQRQEHYFGIDYSFGEENHQEWYHVVLMLFKLAQEFIIQTGVATQEELDHLSERVSIEMELPNFRAILPCLTVWGKVPRETPA